MPKMTDEGKQKRHVHFTTDAPVIINPNDNDDVCDNNANEERQIDDVDIRAERERLSREKQIRAAKEKDCFPSNRSRSCSM